FQGFGEDFAGDGLAQEAVEAGGGGLGFGVGVGAGSDRQQRGGEAAGAQLAGQGEAVDAGQVQVEQGKVEPARGGFGQRGQAVGGVGDLVALGAQQAGDHFGHGGVVLDQQQLQRAGGGAAGAAGGRGCGCLRGGQRQFDAEAGALPRRAVDFDPAAHGVGQFLADRQ